jgi:flagellar biosynthesis/type III secretory pathway M-ring protein FliF/YscJ
VTPSNILTVTPSFQPTLQPTYYDQVDQATFGVATEQQRIALSFIIIGTVLGGCCCICCLWALLARRRKKKRKYAEEREEEEDPPRHPLEVQEVENGTKDVALIDESISETDLQVGNISELMV